MIIFVDNLIINKGVEILSKKHHNITGIAILCTYFMR